MARGDNGYITITAGMPDPGMRRPVDANRHMSRGELCELALKLRKQGWSYRRVSAELRVDYSTVRRWLDGDISMTAPLAPVTSRRGPPAGVVAVPPIPMSAGMPAAPPAEASAVLRDLAAENRRLGEQVERLAAAQEAQIRAFAELEVRLVDAMDAQHRTLVERLIEAFKSLFVKGAVPG